MDFHNFKRNLVSKNVLKNIVLFKMGELRCEESALLKLAEWSTH